MKEEKIARDRTAVPWVMKEAEIYKTLEKSKGSMGCKGSMVFDGGIRIGGNEYICTPCDHATRYAHLDQQAWLKILPKSWC